MKKFLLGFIVAVTAMVMMTDGVLADTATDEDKAYLAQLETQAEAYRYEIKQLQELNK